MLTEVFVFAGCTALFVFALMLMEDGLKHLAGRSFKKFLQKQTENKFRAILGGTIVTGVLQSSSVVKLMTLSFVGAGIMSMRNAMAVSFGSNLGTTLDSWLVATLGFKTNFATVAYILLTLTLIGLFFQKNGRLKNLLSFITGFSLIFISLELMKQSGSRLIKGYDIASLSEYSPYLFIPIGFFITFLIQSSSATVAITLTALHNNAVPFDAALGVIIGSELGTAMKLIIGSVKGIPDKKRVAAGNFIFNIVITVIGCVLLPVYPSFLQNTIGIKDNLIAFVLFQTLINIIGIIVFYPFMNMYGDFLEKLFRKEKEVKRTLYIHKTNPDFPEDNMVLAEKEILHLLKKVAAFNRFLLNIEQKKNSSHVLNYLKEMGFSSKSSEEMYKELKLLQGDILGFLTNIIEYGPDKGSIERNADLIAACRNAIRSAKSIKDIAHNLDDFKASSNDALHDLYLKIIDVEIKFYHKIEELLSLEQPSEKELEALRIENRKVYENFVSEILQLLNHKKITKLDAANLMNVSREIFSSHKAIKKILGDLWNFKPSAA